MENSKKKKKNYIYLSAFVYEETQGIFCFDFLLPNYLRRNVRFKASLYTTFHEFLVYPEFVENLLTNSTLKLSISTFRLAALLTKFVVSVVFVVNEDRHSTGSDEVFPLSLGVESAGEASLTCSATSGVSLFSTSAAEKRTWLSQSCKVSDSYFATRIYRTRLVSRDRYKYQLEIDEIEIRINIK